MMIPGIIISSLQPYEMDKKSLWDFNNLKKLEKQRKAAFSHRGRHFERWEFHKTA